MAARKKATVTPASRQEKLRATLIEEIVTILGEVKKPTEKKALTKLTVQQQAAVDSLNRNDFGCQRKQVVDLVSAIVGKDLSSLVTKEVKSDFAGPVVLKWIDNKDEIGIGLRKDSDGDIGFIYIDSDGDACFDWIDSGNFEEASLQDLVKSLNNAKVASVAKILSDLTEEMEKKS